MNEYIDFMIFDLKHINKKKHLEFTGQDNGLIIDNFKKAKKMMKDRMIVRIPIIPGFNSNDEDISDIGDFKI